MRGRCFSQSTEAWSRTTSASSIRAKLHLKTNHTCQLKIQHVQITLGMRHTNADTTGLQTRSKIGDFLLIYLLQFRALTSVHLLIEVDFDMTSSQAYDITGQNATSGPTCTVKPHTVQTAEYQEEAQNISLPQGLVMRESHQH